MNGRTRLHRDGLIMTVLLVAAVSFTVGVLVGRGVLVITCHYCGEQIDPVIDRFRQAVWGWEVRVTTRASGSSGGSDIQHRRRFDRFAHQRCIDLDQAGVSVRQQVLV